MKGIYLMRVGGQPYVGKDSNIESKTRYKTHLNNLKKGTHTNHKMQDAFNNDNSTSFEVLYVLKDEEDIDFLDNKEREFIISLNTLEEGLNLVGGGGGGQNPSYGELNGMAKISNEQFYEVVDMLRAGASNEDIAEAYNLHTRYVSLIRHKRRFKHLWETIDDYQPEISKGKDKNKKLSFESFKEVTKMLQEGATNASIERKFHLASGTGSKIRHKKLYKEWWEKV